MKVGARVNPHADRPMTVSSFSLLFFLSVQLSVRGPWSIHLPPVLFTVFFHLFFHLSSLALKHLYRSSSDLVQTPLHRHSQRFVPASCTLEMPSVKTPSRSYPEPKLPYDSPPRPQQVEGWL